MLSLRNIEALDEWDRDYFKEYEGVDNVKYVANSMGCSCCSYRKPLTSEILEKYISELGTELSYAISLRDKL